MNNLTQRQHRVTFLLLFFLLTQIGFFTGCELVETTSVSEHNRILQERLNNLNSSNFNYSRCPTVLVQDIIVTYGHNTVRPTKTTKVSTEIH